MAILTHPLQQASHAQRHHPRHAMRAALFALAAGWTVGCLPAHAQAPPVSEHQLQAAFLVKFPNYAEWPADAFADTNSPIVIVVLGASEVIEDLQRIIQGRSVNGRTLVLKTLASGSDPGLCHILFISAEEQRRASHRLVPRRASGILTVGESSDFLAHGGIIALAWRDETIALEVNLAAATLARIKISAKLLAVATVVRDPENGLR